MSGIDKPLTRRLHNVMVWPELLRIHTIPKVASATINAAFIPRKDALERTAARPDEPGPEFRLGFVRHPADRLISAWAYFCNADTDHEIETQQKLKALGYYHGMALDDFIAAALDKHNLDDHTSMQAHWIGNEPFDLLLPLTDLPHVWPTLVEMFPICLRALRDEKIHESRRSDETIAPRLYSAIEDEFSEDVELFEAAMFWGLRPEETFTDWAERRAYHIERAL